MNAKIITVLSLATIYITGSIFAEDGNLKVIKTTDGRVLITASGNPQADVKALAQVPNIKSEEDHISTESVSSDEHLKLYIKVSNEGLGLIQSGQYKEAAERLKEAIYIDPGMPQAYINLANAYYHMGKYEDSIEMSENALQIDPNNANSYGNLGNAYYGLGKYKKSKESYQKAKELFKKDKDLEGTQKTEKYLAQPLLR